MSKETDPPFTLMTEATYFSETQLPIYHTTRRIEEETNLLRDGRMYLKCISQKLPCWCAGLLSGVCTRRIQGTVIPRHI